MNAAAADVLTTSLALVGAVIVVAALLSGVIERSGLPQVAVFLALGAMLGPGGLGLLDITLTSPVLRLVATLSLVLVLFTDAVTMDLAWVRQHTTLALRVLGPGTLLSATVIALAAWWLLHLAPPAAAILGAALASTDPVLLRGLLRRRRLPPGTREVLRVESGLNDGVLLPIVLVALAFIPRTTLPPGALPEAGTVAVPPDAAIGARLALDLLLLGPGTGAAVGLLAVAALDLVRRQLGVRRDYESLYSLGVALAAYAAAEAVHGSGFVAAFIAGLLIAALDVELCDCFLEYGETTAELALLFAFVLFGSSLIWTGFGMLDGPTLAFAAVALLARPAVFLVSLAGSSLELRSRLFVAWFGPRGLSSLLLVLLPAFAGTSGSDRLFAICSLVVLLSVALHGGAPLLPIWTRHRLPAASPEAAGASLEEPGEPPGAPATAPAPSTLTPPRARLYIDGPQEATASAPPIPAPSVVPAPAARPSEPPQDTSLESEPAGNDRISLKELQQLQAAGQHVVLLDARTERTYRRDERQAAGAIRFPPDHVAERAASLGLDPDTWLIVYCA